MSKRSLLPLLVIAALMLPAGSAFSAEVQTDEAGRIVRSVDDQGVVTIYLYDAEGRLLDVRTADEASAPAEPSEEPAEE
jgi:YD repeat-containing protein